jgi:hypothetical protein
VGRRSLPAGHTVVSPARVRQLVVRLGAERGVATPVHEFIYRSLAPLELKARGTISR